VFSYWAYQELGATFALFVAGMGVAVGAHGVVLAFVRRRLVP
jgi:hypothetical protein